MCKKGELFTHHAPCSAGFIAGKGNDWVRVEKIDEQNFPEHQYIAMQVRPAVPPFYNEGQVAHFFDRDATSTFCIERKGKK
jgi:hypothetical protein